MKPEQIRRRRTAQGLSQAEVARSLRVTQPTISNWESGRTTPSTDQVKVLRGLLGSPSRSATAEQAPDSSAAYGDWLSATRIGQGLSRAELAARSGVSAPQIFNIETGRTQSPRQSTQERLERALGAGAPEEVVEAVEQEAEIEDVGRYVDFDPHDESDYPAEPGVYVFYDISDRPIYVGESGNIRTRIKRDHLEKFWYRTPIVEKASFVRVEDQKLRRQLENTLIKFLKSNAVINRRQVER